MTEPTVDVNWPIYLNHQNFDCFHGQKMLQDGNFPPYTFGGNWAGKDSIKFKYSDNFGSTLSQPLFSTWQVLLIHQYRSLWLVCHLVMRIVHFFNFVFVFLRLFIDLIADSSWFEMAMIHALVLAMAFYKINRSMVLGNEENRSSNKRKNERK